MLNVTQLVGFGISRTYPMWDSANKDADCTLSNGNLTAAFSALGGVRATISKSTGKWFYEFTIGGASENYWFIGVQTSAAAVTNVPGADAFGYSYASDARKFNNATFAAYGATYAVGDVIGVALDLDAGSLVYYKNGVSQGTAFTGISGTFFPAVGGGAGSSITGTANFGERAFAYSVPAGFNPGWFS